MPRKKEKTNAMRVLDRAKVPYEPVYFPPEIHSADGVAEAIGVPAGHVYKTLVVIRPNGRPLLAMVAGDRHLSLKKVAKAAGAKSVRMATYREAERMTGLKVGGISALALLNKGFDMLIDRRALNLERVFVSAGKRGINLQLPVADLMRITGATPADISVPSEGSE
jgi:Cys-tRNA(Pro)/Cys-tRNA(Cys) deacylase